LVLAIAWVYKPCASRRPNGESGSFGRPRSLLMTILIAMVHAGDIGDNVARRCSRLVGALSIVRVPHR
jgi:hypothetical protein